MCNKCKKYEARVYIASEGDKLYIGSTVHLHQRTIQHTKDGRTVLESYPSSEETRYADEYRFMQFAEGMGAQLTNKLKRYPDND